MLVRGDNLVELLLLLLAHHGGVVLAAHGDLFFDCQAEMVA